MNAVETLLDQLSVVLPGVSVSNVSIEELMEFDSNDLQVQYRNDTLLYSFFLLLWREAQHVTLLREDKLKDVEVQLEEEYRTSFKMQKEACSQERLRHTYYRDERYLAARSKLREGQHKEALLGSIVEALNKKHTGLTMVAAKEKAEIQSRLNG